MIIPSKTLARGFSMPVFGLGTWGMGGRHEASTEHDDADIAAIERALDAGITHIDTAELYGAGHAEELVWKALQHRDRSHLFLVSKVQRAHLRYDDLLRAAEQSLQRLQTGYLDLYLIHSHNDAIPIADSMRALNRLVDEGIIRNIGVSNFTVPQMEEAMSVSKNPIVANQLQYNLRIREREKQGLLAHAHQHDWMFIAWRPILDVVAMDVMPDVLIRMAKKYDKTPAQIAINWLICQKNVVTLAKCGSREHLEEALNALEWTMEPDDIVLLRRDFPQAAAERF